MLCLVFVDFVCFALCFRLVLCLFCVVVTLSFAVRCFLVVVLCCCVVCALLSCCFCWFGLCVVFVLCFVSLFVVVWLVLDMIVVMFRVLVVPCLFVLFCVAC